MKEIIAKEGMWLTQSHLEDENTRTFGKRVGGYSPTLAEDWMEVDNAFKEQWEKDHQPKEAEL